ncbi:type I methionyl aminopeptidase [Chondrinema litorale]|uniref:type I methionyl aminopeptidase n=1 Tax=Chondrinema litorale TaxID=2994555 RepID=UPI002544CA85|nr:type I methionyl aminopeptidase [Chondrinema litorale]UZR92390.1 type I methionyl aminopeptidase [Chondrinema litorale]
MIYYKTLAEIKAIKESAQILGKAHGEVAKHVKPGISTKDLDKVAEEYIKDNNSTPSFLGYNGFPASLCISVNEVVVHGIPGEYVLKEGDIISIDCGVNHNGFHADSAYTYSVGNIDTKTQELLEVTKDSLYKGINAMTSGGRIGDISFAIQSYAEKHGFSIVRELVGHGVGKKLHEKPDVPNFGKRGRGPKLENGLVIAIEPMINLGTKSIVQERDGWTIRTRDKKPSAHYEHTVAFVDGKPEILTTFEYIENVLATQYA